MRSILPVVLFVVLASTDVVTAQIPNAESESLSAVERAHVREWNRRNVGDRWSILHIAAGIQYVVSYDKLRIRRVKNDEFRYWLRWDELRDDRTYDLVLAENEVKCDTLARRVIREITYTADKVTADAEYSSSKHEDPIPDTVEEALRTLLCRVVFPDWLQKQKTP